MLSFTWDSNFESLPTSSLARSSIDDELRRIKRGVSERMSLEHEWGPASEKNDGSHKGGSVQVALKGSQATRDALTDMQEGALFVVDDGTDIQISRFDGTSWVSGLTSLLHNNLIDRNTGDPHPQYMTPNRSGDFILNANGNAVQLVDPVNSNVLTWDHYDTVHAHTPVDSELSFSDRVLDLSKLKTTIVSGSQSLSTRSFDYTDTIMYDIELSDAPHILKSMKWENYGGNDVVEIVLYTYACTQSFWGTRFGLWVDWGDLGGEKLHYGTLTWEFLRIDS